MGNGALTAHNFGVETVCMQKKQKAETAELASADSLQKKRLESSPFLITLHDFYLDFVVYNARSSQLPPKK